MSVIDVAIEGLRCYGVTARDAARLIEAVDLSDPRLRVLVVPARPYREGDVITMHSPTKAEAVTVVDCQEIPNERVVVVGLASG